MSTRAEDGVFARGLSRRDLLKGMGATALTLAASRWGYARDGVNEAVEAVASTAPKPVRFALLGDWGNGDDAQYAVGEQIAKTHDANAIDLVISTGDNIYPNGSADHFGSNFERPFEPILKRSLPFYVVLGNHDVRKGAQAQMRYAPFNMKDRNYYTVQVGDGTVEFFMLDSNDCDDRQVAWLDRSLQASTAVWKVPVFHHPIYSSGRHGCNTGLAKKIEPVFTRHGVRVAFSGHDHIYQRVTPQQGVQYFVSGAGGKIREGNTDRKSKLCAAAYDSGTHFMLLEADATSFRFAAITETGKRVDEGALATSLATASAAA